MWSKVKRILGYTWASPITACGLIYTILFESLGWHNWYGVEGDALVWTLNQNRAPGWLQTLWKPWGGHTIGNVVVLRYPPAEKPITLVHEQKHVDQCMRLGVFQPLLYALNLLAIKVGCTGSDPYYTNPFEIDARRHAGQVVDVEGTIKRMTSKTKRTQT